MIDMIYETLKKLSEIETRKKPMYITKNEKTGEIIEKPLQDMAAAALIDGIMKQSNPANEIHKAIFGN